MQLKTNIKFGEVSSLTDARYAAGIGAAMIGFNFNPDHPNFIDTEKVKQIAGWIQGPEYVGEFDFNNPDLIRETATELGLEYIQLNFQDILSFEALSDHRIIQCINLDGKPINQLNAELAPYMGAVDFLLLTFSSAAAQENFLSQPAHVQWIQMLCDNHQILFGFIFTPINIMDIIDTLQPFGINLQGSPEIRPGFRDFDQLITLVELLEAESD